MAINTTNYKLVKPTDNEFADISVINANMDIIDREMKKNADDTVKKDGSVQMTGAIKTVGSVTGQAKVQIEMGDNTVLIRDNNAMYLAVNCYANNNIWYRKADGQSVLFHIHGESLAPLYNTAPTGSKDSQITWTINNILTDLGGQISGNLSIFKSIPLISLRDVDTLSYTQIYQYANQAQFRNIKSDGATYSEIELNQPGTSLVDILKLYVAGAGIYKMYGEHNITASTVALGSALSEGAQHQVYA